MHDRHRLHKIRYSEYISCKRTKHVVKGMPRLLVKPGAGAYSTMMSFPELFRGKAIVGCVDFASTPAL